MKTIKDLTTEQKVGQLILAGFYGHEPSEDVRELIEKYHVGNILLFSRNLESPAQALQMNDALQQIAMAAGGVPLAISTDHEGGCTQRLSNGVTTLPGNMALGAIGDEETAYRHGAIQAKELLAMGINQNLGPVLDINMVARSPIIGPRAFGDLAAECARLGAPLVKGMQDHGVNATIKHFPGQGAIAIDTHHDSPSLGLPREELIKRELLPFKAAIDVGAASIMTAHVKLPAIEKQDIPVTMSRAVMTDLLRGEFGYDGVVMSDGLEMQAITRFFPVGEAAVQGLLAGCDMLMVCHTLEEQLEVRNAILKAAEEGRIPAARIDEAAGRVLAMKSRFWDGAAQAAASGTAGIGEHLEQAVEMSRRAVTLLRNDEELLPLKLGEGDKVFTAYAAPVETLEGWEQIKDGATPLGEAFKARHANVADSYVHPVADAAVIEALKKKAAGASLIVVTTISGHNIWGGHPNPLTVFDEQEQMVKGLLQTGIPLIVVSTRLPYDIINLPGAKTALAAYSWWRPSMDAVVDVLFGTVKPAGKLPVEIKSVFKRGHGLSY